MILKAHGPLTWPPWPCTPAPLHASRKKKGRAFDGPAVSGYYPPTTERSIKIITAYQYNNTLTPG